MNQKRAKSLRSAAGYRNQSATPGTMPFPGISKTGRRFPVIETRTAKVKEWSRKLGKYILVTKERIINAGTFSRTGNFYSADPVWKMQWYPKLDAEGKPVSLGPEGKVIDGMGEGEWGEAFGIMPTSLPGRLNGKEPKGLYRALKRLDRKVGIDKVDWRGFTQQHREAVAA